MKYFQEVTEWNAGFDVPNHVYYLTDDKRKMVGYIKAGTKKLITLSKPMNFDSRGRKFVVLNKKAEDDSVYFPKVEDAAPSAASIQVQGSNGKVYLVTKVNKGWTCTCPGYMFRRKCRHVEEQSALA